MRTQCVQVILVTYSQLLAALELVKIKRLT